MMKIGVLKSFTLFKPLLGVYILIGICSSLDTKDVVVVILSQENEYHLKLAENLEAKLQQQAESLHKPHPVVHFLHRDFPHFGGWTILPILPSLCHLHGRNSSWIFFIEDRTEIKLEQLLIILDNYDADDDLFLGHALHDDEATIIHHFAFYDNPTAFKYPNVASGFAITTKLLNRLCERLQETNLNPDFSIDNSHELALFIWDKGNGRKLQHEPKLCTKKRQICATYPKSYLQQCNDSVAPNKSIYFAVKTCEKYHKNRVQVVKNTWGQYAKRINFFSNIKDDTIPTIKLNVPNTEQGHCGKTLAILQYVYKEIFKDPQIRWVVIVDDDTILGVSKLQQLLSCYNPSTSIALGERYGYNVHSPRGYNYITGGGGMVFSRPLVEELVLSEFCECPTNNTPDDMFLGVCLATLGVKVTHSSLFHQARPVDYASGYLNNREAVSFHKHWMIDPITVYNDWFAVDDLRLVNDNNPLSRDEL